MVRDYATRHAFFVFVDPEKTLSGERYPPEA